MLRDLDGVTLDRFANRVWDSRLSLADDLVGAGLARAIDRLARWERVAGGRPVPAWPSAARSRYPTPGRSIYGTGSPSNSPVTTSQISLSCSS